MKITAFNGSPMGASGNTNVMVAAFLKEQKRRVLKSKISF
jgi:multimeric flavodoxin WrbA